MSAPPASWVHAAEGAVDNCSGTGGVTSFVVIRPTNHCKPLPCRVFRALERLVQNRRRSTSSKIAVPRVLIPIPSDGDRTVPQEAPLVTFLSSLGSFWLFLALPPPRRPTWAPSVLSLNAIWFGRLSSVHTHRCIPSKLAKLHGFLVALLRFGRPCFSRGARAWEKPALSLHWLQQQDTRCEGGFICFFFFCYIFRITHSTSPHVPQRFFVAYRDAFVLVFLRDVQF